MKKSVGIFLGVLCTSILVGCGNNNNSSHSTNERVTDESIEESITYKDSLSIDESYKFESNNIMQTPLFDKNSCPYVVMIGNSLLEKGDVAKRFLNISENMGYSVKVDGEYFMGKSIFEEAIYINQVEGYDFIQEELAEADIVIFQEYGGAYDTTLEDIKGLVEKYCKNDVEIYYITTEYDYRSTYLKKLDENNIHVLLMVDFLNEVLTEYDYEYFHLGDGHPNELSGYFSSLFIFSKLYKVNATDVSVDKMDDYSYELLPGDTAEEKEENYNKLAKIIDNIQG